MEILYLKIFFLKLKMSIITNVYQTEIEIFIHPFSEVVSDEIRLKKTFFEFPFLDFCKINYPLHGGGSN